MSGVQPIDGQIVPAHNVIGIVFSVYGLVLVWPVVFVFKQYFRVLDYMQFMFVWGLVILDGTWEFSDHLGVSCWNFFPSFFTQICTSGDLVCSAGGQLTWSVCFVGALFILMIIVNIEKCRRQNLKAQPVYGFFKGILRWTYFPLFYYASKFLVKEIFTQHIKGISVADFYGGIVIDSILILFPIIQLIIYKCIQEPETDKHWIKWIQFFSYARLAFMAIGLAFYDYYKYDPNGIIALYAIIGVFVVYDILYLIGQQFQFKVMGRIWFAVGQAAMITLYCLFLWGYDATSGLSFINTYDLDLFFIAGIILLDLIYYIARIIKAIKNKKQEGQVNPEQNSQAELQKKKNSFDGPKANQQVNSPNFNPNKNKGKPYEVDLQDSRDSLNGGRYNNGSGINAKSNGQSGNLKGSYEKPARRRR